jgi:hypothetical protein
MAVHQIPIDANGITPVVHANHDDYVYWQATASGDGTYPMWYIIFPSPFLEQFIATDPRNGQSGLFRVRKTAATYTYLVASIYNPTQLQTEKPKDPRKPVRVIGGGGIIIDQ